MGSPSGAFPVSIPGKTGWPWYELGVSEQSASAGKPVISVVTPSYNQARFIEETLRSVLLQGHHRLEYVVIEDGSTDRSPEIIQRYRPWLSQYVSGPNRGFGEAVNAGLQLCTGEIMAYLNADDLYLPGAFDTVVKIFADCPEVDWIAGASYMADRNGHNYGINSALGYSRDLFFSGRYLGGHPAWGGKWIPQESVFWRRSLWEKAGGYFLKERLQYGDFELWCRFWQFAELHVVSVPLGVYRSHEATYTSIQGSSSLKPCTKLIDGQNGRKFSPAAIRLKEWTGRLGASFMAMCGQPARALEYDRQAGMWRSVTRLVV